MKALASATRVWGLGRVISGVNRNRRPGALLCVVWVSPSTFHCVWELWSVCLARLTDTPPTHSSFWFDKLLPIVFWAFFSFLLRSFFFFCLQSWRLLSKCWGNMQQLFPFSLQIKFRGVHPFKCRATLFIQKNELCWQVARGRPKVDFWWVVVIFVVKNIHGD